MSAALDLLRCVIASMLAPQRLATLARLLSSARATVSADRGLVHSRVRSTTYYVSFLGLYTLLST